MHVALTLDRVRILHYVTHYHQRLRILYVNNISFLIHMILSPSGKQVGNLRTLIGICGYARSGKDTVGDQLNRRYSYRGARFGFADALKQYVANELHTSIGAVNALKNKDPDFRSYLIAVGTRERKKDPDYWIKCLCSIVGCNTSAYHLIVPDVRFDNEDYWLQAQGGILIKVTRPGVVQGTDTSESSHLYFDPHITIDNSYDLTTLLYNADYVHHYISSPPECRIPAPKGVSINREWQQPKG